jgi:hypothetical protein
VSDRPRNQEARLVGSLFHDGCCAALAGKSFADNPYPGDSFAGGCWAAGYVFLARRIGFWLDLFISRTLEDAA